MTQTSARPRPWAVAALGGMASYLEGATMLSVGMSIVLFQDDLQLSAWSAGALSSLLLITFAIGAIVGGRLGDRFGRRTVYSADLLVFAAGALTIGLAPDQAVLFTGVTITGLAMGADLPASLALVAEEAPPGKQGAAVALSQTLLLLGIGVSQLIAFFVAPLGALGARLLFLHLLVVALAVWALRRRVTESAAWERVRRSTDPSAWHGLSREHRRKYGASLVATGLFFVIAGLMPNTISQFGTYLVVNVGHSTARVFTLIGTAGLIFGLVIAVCLQRFVDTRYRTVFVAIGLGALVVGPLIPILGHFSLGSLLAMFLCNTLGGTWAGDGMYRVWTQEIFPTEVRSTAQGLTYGVARLLMAACSLVTPTLMSASPSVLMGVLACLGALGAVVGLTVVPRLPRDGRSDALPAAVAAAPALVAPDLN